MMMTGGGGGGGDNILRKENEDYLSKLPDHILTTIVSLLDIKDAVETRILSKKWRYVWTNHSDLRLNILGLDYTHIKEKKIDGDTIFVNFVDRIMEQRSRGIDRINSFCVQFQLGDHFSSSIDGWISSAVRKDVETIDLDFSKFRCYMPSTCLVSHRTGRFKRYNFSLLRTVSENKGSLKNLQLTFCNFRGSSSSKRFDSIVSLQFHDVNISDLQLNKVLQSCPLLEKIVLNSCSKLTCFSIVECNNTLLKTLSLKNLRISEIDLCGNNLISLELDNIEKRIRDFPLNKVLESCPALSDCNNKPLKMLSLKNVFIRDIDFGGNNLISLELEHAYGVDSLKLEKIMKNCPLLEELSLHNGNLTSLKICDSNSSHLKVLSLKCSTQLCFREINICVNNLHTLDYIGKSRSVRFKMEAPRLVNAFIYEEDKCSWYPITRKCLAKPMLQNLVLGLLSYVDFVELLNNLYHDLFHEYSNIKRLALLNFPFDIPKLSWVSCIFECFPKLQTLELNFTTTFNKMESKDIEKDVPLEKCVNGSITRLELNGFVGCKNQVDLLIYLLENLKVLQVLAIGPSYKDYKSFNGWVYSKVDLWHEEMSQFDYEWIRTIIPPFVRLELCP